MAITIAQEDYKTLRRALGAIERYCLDSHYRLPDEVDEERLLFLMLVLQTLCHKIFAYQPSQEKISYTVMMKLKKYFELKPTFQPAPKAAQEMLTACISSGKLIGPFLQRPQLKDISAYIQKTVQSNGLEALRKTLPKTGKMLKDSTPAEIAEGKTYLSAEELQRVWKMCALSQDKRFITLKKALIRGKYIALLDDKELITCLQNAHLYDGLDPLDLAACADIIEAVFPLMSKEEKNQTELIANGKPDEFRNKIFGLRFQHASEQYTLADLFTIPDEKRINRALLDFSRTILADQKGLFYLYYNVEDMDDDLVAGFDCAIESLARRLHNDFLSSSINQDYVLWDYDDFRLIWLLSVIWFRQTIAKFQVPTAQV